MDFLNHFEIEDLAEMAKTYIMSTEEFSRAVFCGERRFVCSYDKTNFSLYKYKSIGLHYLDVTIICGYDNNWVVNSIDFYCDLLFLPRHDFNYDIGIKYHYHIISCDLLDSMTKYERNVINNFLSLLFQEYDGSLELNCDISKFGLISILECKLTNYNYDFIMSKLNSIYISGLKTNKFNLNLSINKDSNDLIDTVLKFYNFSNYILYADRELYIRIELLDNVSSCDIIYYLNDLYNKLFMNGIVHLYSYLVLDIPSVCIDSSWVDDNLFVLKNLKSYFSTVYINGIRVD